jgi:hypothetical protein
MERGSMGIIEDTLKAQGAVVQSTVPVTPSENA